MRNVTNTEIEKMSEDEVSTDEYDIYIPDGLDQNLEVDESAYSLMEFISLEWPSQTLDVFGEDEVILATNAHKNKPSLIKLEFGKTNDFAEMENFSFEKIEVEENYNRVRVAKNVICISDNCLDVFSKRFRPLKRFEGKFGYGLAATNEKIYCGLNDGTLKVIDINKYEVVNREQHKSSIESIDVGCNMIFTASCDKSVKIIDARCSEAIFFKEFDAEINAISFNSSNLVVFGDDNGIIRLMDVRNMEIEEISWHKSPISCVRWKNEDVFGSCSDEQVALWDTGFVGDWEYHRYLGFVHQGQHHYKDLAFKRDSEIVFTTSYEGVCIFSPANE